MKRVAPVLFLICSAAAGSCVARCVSRGDLSDDAGDTAIEQSPSVVVYAAGCPTCVRAMLTTMKLAPASALQSGSCCCPSAVGMML